MPINKIYCGNGKQINFDDGGSLIAVTLDIDVLIKNWEEFGFTARQSQKRMIKVKVCPNRDGPDRYDNTHYIEVDQWKPNGGGGNQAPTPPTQAPAVQTVPPPSSFEDDIPF